MIITTVKPTVEYLTIRLISITHSSIVKHKYEKEVKETPLFTHTQARQADRGLYYFSLGINSTGRLVVPYLQVLDIYYIFPDYVLLWAG